MFSSMLLYNVDLKMKQLIVKFTIITTAIKSSYQIL